MGPFYYNIKALKQTCSRASGQAQENELNRMGESPSFSTLTDCAQFWDK